MRIIDVCCRWPGASHDATIFANSALCEKMDNGDYGTDSVLLGDSAYGVDYYMCKPLRNPITNAETNYQQSQIKSRNVAERAFGVLKRRFPCLQLGMHFRLDKVQDVVVACCILKNFLAQEFNDDHHFEIIDPIGRHEIEFQMDISQNLLEEQQIHRQNHPNRIMRIQDFLITNYFIRFNR